MAKLPFVAATVGIRAFYVAGGSPLAPGEAWRVGDPLAT
jgi:hypothetical protein